MDHPTPRSRPEELRVRYSELREGLSDFLNRVQYRGERVVVHRRGKDAAALVSLEDLELLERLEDQALAEMAREAREEGGASVPLEEYLRRRNVS